MRDYKFKRVDSFGYIITEDGHTMFPEDVKLRLDRLNHLEAEKVSNVAEPGSCVIIDVRKAG